MTNTERRSTPPRKDDMVKELDAVLNAFQADLEHGHMNRVCRAFMEQFGWQIKARLSESAPTADEVGNLRQLLGAALFRLKELGDTKFELPPPASRCVAVTPDKLAREYAKDCETLARYIVPTAPKFVRDIADGWIGDDERDGER